MIFKDSNFFPPKDVLSSPQLNLPSRIGEKMIKSNASFNILLLHVEMTYELSGVRFASQVFLSPSPPQVLLMVRNQLFPIVLLWCRLDMKIFSTFSSSLFSSHQVVRGDGIDFYVNDKNGNTIQMIREKQRELIE